MEVDPPEGQEAAFLTPIVENQAFNGSFSIPAGTPQAAAAMPAPAFKAADIPKEKMDVIVSLLSDILQGAQKTQTVQSSTEKPAQTVKLVAPRTFKEANSLLSPEGALVLDHDFSTAQALEAWLVWCTVCFHQFKTFKVSPDLAAQVLRANLPKSLRDRIGRTTSAMTPEKVVELVNSQLIGSTETSLIFFEGIAYLLNNRVTSGSELMQKLTIWFAQLPYNDTLARMRCDAAYYLLPENARRRMRDWDEYRMKEYEALWTRLDRDIGLLVTDQELAALQPERRLRNNLSNSAEMTYGKRRRIKRETSSRSDYEYSSRSFESDSTPAKNRDRIVMNTPPSNTRPPKWERNKDRSTRRNREVCDYCKNPGHSSKFCVTEKKDLRKALKDQRNSSVSTILYLQNKAIVDNPEPNLIPHSLETQISGLTLKAQLAQQEPDCYGLGKMFLGLF